MVMIKYQSAEDICVKMDIFNTQNKMCGPALLENANDETSFSVETSFDLIQNIRCWIIHSTGVSDGLRAERKEKFACR